MGGRLLRPERGAKGGGRGATLGGRTVVVPGPARAQPDVNVSLGPGAAEPCSKSLTACPRLCPSHWPAARVRSAGRRGRDPHVALAAAHRDGAGHDGGQEAAAVRGGAKRGRAGVGELPLGRQWQALRWPCWSHPGNVLHALELLVPRLRSASIQSLRTSCTACSTMTTRTSSSCASGENRSQVE